MAARPPVAALQRADTGRVRCQTGPMAADTALTPDALRTAMADLPDWTAALGALHIAYAAPTADAALELVHTIGREANAVDHHPDLDWRYDHVFVRLTSHSAGSEVTAEDIALAATISRLATEAEATARPDLIRPLTIGVDTRDATAIRSYWERALGYRPGRKDHLVDPWGRGPQVWFQETETPDPSRIHLDVYSAGERARSLRDAVAAEGRLVDDGFAPLWWVTADADGNRICVCTEEE